MNSTATTSAVRPVRPPSLDAGGGLDVRRDGGRAEHPADGGADGVGHQRLVDVGEVAVLVEEAGGLPDAGECAGGVEEVNEEEREDDERERHALDVLQSLNERASQRRDVVAAALYAMGTSGASGTGDCRVAPYSSIACSAG